MSRSVPADGMGPRAVGQGMCGVVWFFGRCSLFFSSSVVVDLDVYQIVE